MEMILIVGAVYNLIGAIYIWFVALPTITEIGNIPSDYMQYRIFTGGTAAVFGSIYLYIYFVPSQAIPLLIFGAVLKLWSFVSSLICYVRFGYSSADFLKVGVANLVIAVLFVLYLI